MDSQDGRLLCESQALCTLQGCKEHLNLSAAGWLCSSQYENHMHHGMSYQVYTEHAVYGSAWAHAQWPLNQSSFFLLVQEKKKIKTTVQHKLY